MKKCNLPVAVAAILSSLGSSYASADEFYKALSEGEVFGNFNLRYEAVEQDNALEDASAFTLRTRLGYKSGSLDGFSFTVEMEDNRIVLGEGDYASPPNGYNTGIYSVIADPEHTELDQGFIQYKNDNLTVKVGRQVITHDGHRFIGHVGWRQDRQTFDAATVVYAPNKDLKLTYSYIGKRNRIFGEDADLDAKDHLFHGSYKTEFGTLAVYSYLLEVDNDTDNALDTYGIRFAGKRKVDDFSIVYHLEYASQSNETAASDFNTDYLFAEIGAVFSGVTAKVGYEVLGSDDGMMGFQTPLATLHKFNGWADQFLGTPAQGLEDVTFTLTGAVAGGKWLAVYHDYSADEASATVDDLGSEINLQYLKTFNKHYKFGVKYAAYSGESGRVDTDKLWLWLNVGF
ncbi:alginate export family protein [Alteromonas sp. ASW11-36]|uniref:Alginate export family protein n=1 Tax=Alteromonas arenosi TaxID=3055817 RepID=A0ABT7SY54_9ALTE|nr:alginate export family protein [Alteromonas sp. ASW11-36]MDM7860462.1 alginate export family protein [Alteromonas sp. ASW11-36]